MALYGENHFLLFWFVKQLLLSYIMFPIYYKISNKFPTSS